MLHFRKKEFLESLGQVFIRREEVKPIYLTMDCFLSSEEKGRASPAPPGLRRRFAGFGVQSHSYSRPVHQSHVPTFP